MLNMQPAVNSNCSTENKQIHSPWQRNWQRFKQNRMGYWSLIIFTALFACSLGAELWSNDKPLLLRYQGNWYFPLIKDYPEATFGGDFPTPADYLDPFIQERLNQPGNWAIWPANSYSYNTINYFGQLSDPAPPSKENWLGTDDRGRDILAQLVYGFRLSILFGLTLTLISAILGTISGALMGFFGGRVDLFAQRLIEIWGAIPELYLLIIFSALFKPSVGLLIILLSLFGWIGLSDYVRAEFYRNRNLEYVRAARALGLSNWQIMWRHILPNSLTPIITFLPFRISAAILALTSLDFLGLGVPSSTPSLGGLLAQGKANLDSWWISLSTFLVLMISLLLLTLIGDALRDAFDTRKGEKK
jgi:microcin C transport system permease protein